MQPLVPAKKRKHPCKKRDINKTKQNKPDFAFTGVANRRKNKVKSSANISKKMIWSNRLLIISGSCITTACLLFDFPAHKPLIAIEDLIPKKLKLTQVQVVFRHGARSPLIKVEDFNTTFSESIWDKSILERTLEHTNIPIIVKLHNGECGNELLDKVYKGKPTLQVVIYFIYFVRGLGHSTLQIFNGLFLLRFYSFC